MNVSKVFMLAFLLIPCFVGARAGEPPGNPVKDDLEKLQGEWIPVSMLHDKQPKPYMTFVGEKLSMNGRTGTMTIDPLKNPKTMLATFGEEKYTWIYRIDGDGLVVAFGVVGGPVPGDFREDGFKTISQVVHMKQKAKQKPPE